MKTKEQTINRRSVRKFVRSQKRVQINANASIMSQPAPVFAYAGR